MKADCVLIANALPARFHDNINIAQGSPIAGSFYKPLFLDFNKMMTGAVIILESFPDDFFNKIGIIKARQQFMQAVQYAVERLDIRLVLLAASTKRLFGKELELRINRSGNLDNDGFTLHEIYPDILFTNGDNGTAVILNMETDKLLEKAEIITINNYVLINGLGLLGFDSLQHLIGKNLNDEQIIIISNHASNLSDITEGRNIKVFPSIDMIDIPNPEIITAIINCTHNPSSLITAANLNSIQQGQSIHVIDVAVPYGFSEEELNKCNNVFRQDGGNAYFESGLEFYFNPDLCALTDKVIYGCFTEAVALSAYVGNSDYIFNSLKGYDFFNVNSETKEFVKQLFDKFQIGIAPKSYNFNRETL